tara:strand:- start:535 stop:1182 length:648 start_codon:yes stop_codon:yes gene_type:complete
MWDNVTGELEKHFFVISFDIRGAGKSANLDKDPKSYSFETYSDDLNKILQLLGVEKFHIWSMAWGTRAALAYTSLFPQKICSAVFSDASIGRADVEAQKSGLRDALKKQDEAGLRRHDMPKGWNEHLNSESAQLSLSAAAKFDFTKVIKKINFPFLVMTGDHDPNLSSSKEMVKGSEIGQIKVLEGVGHGSVLQRPDLTLEGFLNWHHEIRDSNA